ncbi:MAG: hypothetical protein ACLQPD_25325 [Desulfomonilaceae bacterium]
MPISVTNQLYKKYTLSVTITHKALFFLCISALIIFSPVPPAFSAQTRDQCEKCCRSSTQDEYYSEQCKLKCFRNPDHCADQKSKPDGQEEVTLPSPTPRARVRPPAVAPGPTPPRVSGPPPSAPGTMGPPPSAPGMMGPPPGGPIIPGPPATAQRPPAQPQSAAPPGGMTPRHASQRGMLVFPSPLNLVPGREPEAAGQILNLNGISPQHPNYAAGVQAITGILQNFARNNPSGGSLPTDDMQRVIIQLKQ